MVTIRITLHILGADCQYKKKPYGSYSGRIVNGDCDLSVGFFKDLQYFQGW
jgi:hypothetical protein